MLCNDVEQKRFEGILGVSLPRCADVVATVDGGIKAESTNDFGSKHIVAIGSDGSVNESFLCSETEKQGSIAWDSKITADTYCKIPKWNTFFPYFPRHEPAGSVSPQKLAEAKAVLLKEGKQEKPAKIEDYLRNENEIDPKNYPLELIMVPNKDLDKP